MCTVTLVARRRGFTLGMNRDEQRSRPPGLPPAVHPTGPLLSVLPREPAGGSWIGVNSTGAAFALINWYSAPGRPRGTPTSRGAVVPALLATASPEEASQALRRLPLETIPPFRLIGVFPQTRQVLEWAWDPSHLSKRHLPWNITVWASSGFDEQGAQHTRGETFRNACRHASAGTTDWVRRLHRSHQPQPGPYSICMHRDDAVTVSYTEVTVGGRLARMRHLGGSPCRIASSTWTETRLALPCNPRANPPPPADRGIHLTP